MTATPYQIQRMGKVRKEKTYRVHRKTLATSSGPAAASSRDGSSLAATGSPLPAGGGVVPLPEDIMKCKAVVSLTTEAPAGGDSGPRKKRERMKLKREHWLQKIELSKKQKKEEKAAEERKKTVVVGDMQPLATSLPTIISSSEKLPHKETKTSKKPRRSVLNEISHYHDVLKHPAFKQDPMSTILEHVQNSVATGAV